MVGYTYYYYYYKRIHCPFFVFIISLSFFTTAAHPLHNLFYSFPYFYTPSYCNHTHRLLLCYLLSAYIYINMGIHWVRSYGTSLLCSASALFDVPIHIFFISRYLLAAIFCALLFKNSRFV